MRKVLIVALALTGFMSAEAASAADNPQEANPSAATQPPACPPTPPKQPACPPTPPTPPPAPLPTPTPLKWVGAPPPSYDWTGFYLGLNGGGGWGQSRQDISPLGQTTGNFAVTGGLVGGTIGFNLQIDQIVYGLEGDLDWANISGSASCRLGAFSCTTQSDFLGTARGRLGYAWPGRWLTYVTGGAAFTDIDQSFSPAVGANSGAPFNKFGWTAGGGVQYGFGWYGNWAVKFEYLFVDAGVFSCTLACSGLAGQVTKTTLTESIFRTGIDYRF